MSVLSTRAGVTDKLFNNFDTSMMLSNMKDVLHIVPSLFKEVSAVAGNQEDAMDVLLELLIPELKLVTERANSILLLTRLERLVFNVILDTKLRKMISS